VIDVIYNSTKKPILFLVMICCVTLSGCGKYPPSAIWEYEIKQFEISDKINPPEKNQILFIGSSSIRKWETLEDDMLPLPVIRRGFGGSNMNDAIHYAHRIVIPYDPNIIVIYEGGNDIGLFRIKPELVRDKYVEFIETIRIELPNTPIYFISIKPSIDRREQWEESAYTNELIQELSLADPLLNYIDVASSMLDENGMINEDLFVDDGEHLNEQGYAIWTQVIKPVLEQAYPYENHETIFFDSLQ
jgi:lysophospholipase L1-like esterase